MKNYTARRKAYKKKRQQRQLLAEWSEATLAKRLKEMLKQN